MRLNNDYTILAIDTSCDETAVAVTQGRRVMANVLASQVELHRKYGGVYPIEAKRAHEEKIDDVVEEALGRFGVTMKKTLGEEQAKVLKQVQDDKDGAWNKIDAVAVTRGPGLAPALEVGITKAKELAKKYNKPLIAVNHMEGHLLSCLAQNSKGGGKNVMNRVSTDAMVNCRGSRIAITGVHATGMTEVFPVLGLLVSGGHTELVLIKSMGDYEVVGKTVDDAAGECLDKVARMLGLGYPGGAVIEELAKQGNPRAINFPIPMKGKPGYDFSFSGLKTAALYEIRARKRGGDRSMPEGGDVMVSSIQWGEEDLSREYIVDFCASIQWAVIEALLYKTEKAIQAYSPTLLWLGGGVGANVALRRSLRDMCGKYAVKVGIPYSDALWGDNAAMIGVAGYFKVLRGEFMEDLSELEREPRLDL